MKEREATIEPTGRERIPQAIERLVLSYETIGNTTEAAAWRDELAKCRAAMGGARK